MLAEQEFIRKRKVGECRGSDWSQKAHLCVDAGSSCGDDEAKLALVGDGENKNES